MFRCESTFFNLQLVNYFFNMLRRQPTTIQLTQADIDRYEANRQRKLRDQQQQRQQDQHQSASSQSSQNSNGAQQAPQKTNKDRIMGGR